MIEHAAILPVGRRAIIFRSGDAISLRATGLLAIEKYLEDDISTQAVLRRNDVRTILPARRLAVIATLALITAESSLPSRNKLYRRCHIFASRIASFLN